MNDIAAIASSPLWIQKERGAHRSPLRIVCTSRWRTASRHVVHIGSCMYRAIANERAKSWALALAMSMYMQFSIRRVAACIGFAPFQFRSVLVANTSTRTIECQARNPLSIIFGDFAQHICKSSRNTYEICQPGNVHGIALKNAVALVFEKKGLETTGVL